MTGILIVFIAAFVAISLPKWATKLVPTSVDKKEVPSGISLGLRVLIAFLAGSGAVVWKALTAGIDKGFFAIQDVSKEVDKLLSISIPNAVIGAMAIAGSIWILYIVFKSLTVPKTAGQAGINIAIVFLLFAFSGTVWGGLGDYFLGNLQGAQLLFQTESWKAIFPPQ